VFDESVIQTDDAFKARKHAQSLEIERVRSGAAGKFQRISKGCETTASMNHALQMMIKAEMKKRIERVSAWKQNLGRARWGDAVTDCSTGKGNPHRIPYLMNI